jgi:hypothetical protein
MSASARPAAPKCNPYKVHIFPPHSLVGLLCEFSARFPVAPRRCVSAAPDNQCKVTLGISFSQFLHDCPSLLSSPPRLVNQPPSSHLNLLPASALATSRDPLFLSSDRTTVAALFSWSISLSLASDSPSHSDGPMCDGMFLNRHPFILCNA